MSYVTATELALSLSRLSAGWQAPLLRSQILTNAGYIETCSIGRTVCAACELNPFFGCLSIIIIIIKERPPLSRTRRRSSLPGIAEGKGPVSSVGIAAYKLIISCSACGFAGETSPQVGCTELN
jgi:hypothetical protein